MLEAQMPVFQFTTSRLHYAPFAAHAVAATPQWQVSA